MTFDLQRALSPEVGSAVAAGVGISALTGAVTGAAGVSAAVCVTGAGIGVGAGAATGAGAGVEVEGAAGLDDDAPALGYV